MRTTLSLIFLCSLTVLSKAQYWRTIHPSEKLPLYTFSFDDKRIITFEADGRITAFDLKTSTSSEIAIAADRRLAMQLMARPYLLYSKNVDLDHHIFRLKLDGISTEEDVTPVTGTLNTILGQSYTGRYIYYSSFQKSRNKTDFYRYDAQQNISELVLANDKNFTVHAWSRDQKRLLVENPATKELIIVDVTSTDRFPIYTPLGAKHIVSAGWSPDNKEILVLEHSDAGAELRRIPMTSTTTVGENIQVIKEGNISSYNLSPTGKYITLSDGEKDSIYEFATMAPLILPEGAKTVVFNARETLALYHTTTGAKFLYDIAKQTSRELVAK
jgi:Tol biopolymer transport system component